MGEDINDQVKHYEKREGGWRTGRRGTEEKEVSEWAGRTEKEATERAGRTEEELT